MILSRSFFNKRWLELELNALIARMTYEDRELILPIWHEIGLKDFLSYSPLLSDIKALSTKDGLESITTEILIIVEKPSETGQTRINGEHRGILADVSEENVRFYVARANSTNTDVKSAALRDLEKISRTNRLWKHDGV